MKRLQQIFTICFAVLCSITVGAGEASTGFDEGRLQVGDGIELYWKAAGSGPAVIIPNALYMERDFAWLADQYRVIFYDLRNRGRSSVVSDADELARGIYADVADLEAVRSHFGLDTVAVIGHSYVGLTVLMWTLEHPERVQRVVVVSALPPDVAKPYPSAASLRQGSVYVNASKTLTQWLADAQTSDPESQEKQLALCNRYWEILSGVMVGDPANAPRVFHESYCQWPNETPLRMLNHLGTSIFPTIQSLKLDPEALSELETPVLLIHGTLDRNAPFEGAVDWRQQLGNARLLGVEGAAHLPYLENPAAVNRAIGVFLDGQWPTAAEPANSE